MTDLTNQYTIREMLDAMRQSPRPSTFLQDRLVSTVKTTDKKYLEIDIVKGTELISPYVHRDGGPTPVGKGDYENLLHLAPYLYDEGVLSPGDADTRQAGNTIYESSAVSNMDAEAANLLAGFQDRMIRREEQQLAEALRTGKAAIEGKDVKYTIDYKMNAANIIALTGANAWGSGTEDKLAQFEAWAQIPMNASAPMPTECYMHLDVWQDIRADDTISALLDNRRTEQGKIEYKQLKEQKATFCGSLQGVGLDVDLFVYYGSYIADDTTTRVQYIPSKHLFFTNPAIRVDKQYTKIENHHANFVGQRFPLDWTTQNGKHRYISLESGPLVSLNQPDGVVSVKVKP